MKTQLQKEFETVTVLGMVFGVIVVVLIVLLLVWMVRKGPPPPPWPPG